MTLKLREFGINENDYAAAARIITAVWPEDPATAEELREGERHRDRNAIHGRVLAEIDGEIVAFCVYGQTNPASQPGSFFVNLQVHPKHQRKGVGQRIYDHILGPLSSHRPEIFVADTREHQIGAVCFLKKHGFKVIQRRPLLCLDVGSFDRARVPPAICQSIKPNIRIAALDDLVSEVPDWKRRCWDLEWDIVQDIPTTDAPVRPGFESYARMLEDPGLTGQSWFVALQDDDWVGMSIIESNPSTPGRFYTSLTGVRRPFRRRGIATALKLHGIDHVRSMDGHSIETDNAENNPILNLNLSLGFKQQTAILEFQKTL